MNLKSVWAFSIYAAILNNWILKLLIGFLLVSLFNLDIEGNGYLSASPMIINAALTKFFVPDKYLTQDNDQKPIPTSFLPFYKVSLLIFTIQVILGELIGVFTKYAFL